MKRWVFGILSAAILLLCTACSQQSKQPNIVATTMPVYTFTQALCKNTPLSVTQLVQENISCLHDYTLTVRHMQLLEGADLLVVSGGGLESFLSDALPDNKITIDASDGIDLHCNTHAHEHEDGHQHDVDPHFWLSIQNGKHMAQAICNGLKSNFPQYTDLFDQNLSELNDAFDQLEDYADSKLSDLTCRNIITFHDGFSYMAEDFDLAILKAIEEESGSEASAKDLISICNLITENSLPAIFVEKNSSFGAASVVSHETGAQVYTLDTAISGSNYFDAMYHNIDTLKEALG